MADDRTPVEQVTWWSDQLARVGTPAGEMAVFQAGEGDPVVMLHGIPTSSYLWRDVAAIVAHGHQVIAPDLIGFGFSEKPDDADLSPSGQADAVLHVLEQLGVSSFSLVGHDYGALVACEILRRHPDRVEHLALLNTSLQVEDWTSASILNPLTVLKVPVAGEVAMKLSNAAILRQAFAIFVDETDRLDLNTMAVYWHPFTEGFDRTLIQLARNNELDEDTFHDWKAALWDYGKPSLVVWGGNDPAFRPDRAHEIVRLLGNNCRYELFIHSNHFIQEDRPMALGRLIAAYIEGHLRD